MILPPSVGAPEQYNPLLPTFELGIDELIQWMSFLIAFCPPHCISELDLRWCALMCLFTVTVL